MLGLRTKHTHSYLSQQIQHLFQEPYCHWPAEDILHHFSQRNSIAYFPVIDPVETRREKIENIVRDEFEFNGETQCNLSPIRWTHNPSQDQEWLILLHKFYYAVGLGMAFTDTQDRRYLEKWVELTDSWINLVPLNFLPSDVAGRRIQNWIFAHYFFVTQGKAEDIDPEFYMKFLSSLSQQVSYLCRNLTPARNHRTLELCSIFLAGIVFPELREASDWLELAKTELVKNIQSDILPDGVHCELSTDYHHLVLKNFLWVRRLALLNQIIFPDVVDEQIKKALEFALFAHKPDGVIPSLSDGDSRGFLDLLEQGYQLYGNQELRYASLRGMEGTPPLERSKGFPDSGYYILRSGWGDGPEPYEDERYLVFDCGPLGAGNHGHFDLLSFEMAAYDQSLIIDPGRYTYDESGEVNWRVRFRETAAHNTVVVDGKNQTRYVLHKIRHKIRGPHPDHLVKAFISEPSFDFIHGQAQSHEYPVLHERKILFPCLDYWIIIDRLTAQEAHQYDLLFHLNPQAQDAVTVTQANETLAYAAPHVLIAQPLTPSIQGAILQGYASKTYGTKDLAPILRFRQTEAEACFHTVLLPFENHQPDVRIELVPVYAGNRVCLAHEASCLRIRRTLNQESLEDVVFLCHQDIPAQCRFDEYSFQGKVFFLRKNALGEIIHQFEIKSY
ncbi:MAG: heparinase II/III family protein [Nitrospirota bacterium]|nr:heparinase II/III family protein [Nitrospirota bacterium]